MKSKKLIALILSVFMITALVSACGDGGGDTPASTTTTPRSAGGDVEPVDIPSAEELDWITLTMFVAEPGSAPTSDNPVVKMIEEETKVKIDFEFVVGDMDSRVGTMIASGNYPDIINCGQARARFQSSGALIPLQDEIPKYARLWEHYEKYYDKLHAASPDENIYIMDTWTRVYGDPIETFYNGPAFWIQKDVLAWDNYANPKDVDEFFDLLERYTAAHPTIDGQPTLTFEILSDDWRSFCLKNAPQHLNGAPNDGDVFVNQDTYTAEFYQNTDYAKRYYFKLNEVYKKGLISPETFTQNFDQYLAKVSSGRVLAMFDQQWNFEQAEQVLKADGKWERTYVPLGLTFDGIEQWYKTASSFVGGNGLGISVNNKNVERTMMYFDTILREDLTLLATWGIEGTADGEGHYYVDENGRYRRTQEQRDLYEDNQWVLENGAKNLTNHLPKRQGWFSNGNAIQPGDQPEEILENQQPYDKEFFSQYGYSTSADFLTIPRGTPEYFPVWGYNMDDHSKEKDAFDRLTDLQNKHLPRVIMAGDPEAEWATYMAEWDKIPTEDYLDFVNNQIASRMGIDR